MMDSGNKASSNRDREDGVDTIVDDSSFITFGEFPNITRRFQIMLLAYSMVDANKASNNAT